MEKIKKFLISDWFTVILLIGSVGVVFSGNEIIGTVIFVLVFGITMALTDDWMPLLQIIMFTTCFAIRCKNSFSTFLAYWWVVPIMVALIVCHFVRFRAHFAKGMCFSGILATSVAVTLGGVGIISAKEYFSYTSLFYVFMLGFGMLIIYSYMSASLRARDSYSYAEKFSKLMVCVICLLAVCLFEEYFSNRAQLADGFEIIPFQWRNNAATTLMLAMPFAFYLSRKDFGLFFIGIFDYILILFTGSRGGMLFGIVELIICIIVMFILDKRHRPAIAAIVGVSLVITALTYKIWIDTLSYTLMRLVDPNENSIRLQLIPRGIEDFKANPIFGRGIGYMGNRDVHKSADFALCWYHCSPIQIIGSFGILGIAAYGYLIYLRIKTLLRNFTFFNIIMFISYIGLEMMSLVNPGIFAPFPYLFLVTLYFVMMEKSNNDEDKKILPRMIKGEK
ncbi:MAG: O-antigen ligase family protein [Clostridia bacterium]|nr:O-antigen ligase family protein [Clostridia bacterium]MBQ3006526.1 O-antigen ligase family protein [Clostridia bacterium]